MEKRKKEGEYHIKKNITITPEQEQYLSENYINLSHFVQGKLQEEISKKKKKGAK